MINANYWKIGFHTGPSGNRDGIGDYWQALTDQDIPAVLVSADDYGPCYELANLADSSGVPHVIAFRLTTIGQGNIYNFDTPPYETNVQGAASQYWAATLYSLPPEFDKDRVWIIICNEVDKQYSDWLGQFGVAVAELAKQSGHKVLFPAWSSGEPERTHWETGGMKSYIQYCSENPDVAGISIHEYSFTINDLMYEYPYRLGRFQMLLAICADYGWKPPVLITEFGWEERNVPSPDAGMPELEEANLIYNVYPEILGAALWYLGPGYGSIADLAQRYIAPVTSAALNYGLNVWSGELENTGFEQDWQGSHTVLRSSAELFPHVLQVGNIFSPPGWTPWFYYSSAFAQPEIRDTSAVDPDRMHEGEKGMLLFTFYRAHKGGFLQQVPATPGEQYTLSAWAHAWSNHQDGPHPDDPKWSEGAGYDPFWGYTDEITDDELSNFQFRIGIDPYGSIDPYAPTIVWSRGMTIYNAFQMLDEVSVTAKGNFVTVYLSSDTRWPYKHNDAYWDSITLTDDGTEPPPVGSEDEYFWNESVDEQVCCGLQLNTGAGLQNKITEDGLTVVHNEITRVSPDTGLPYVLQAGEDQTGVIQRRTYKWDPRTGNITYIVNPEQPPPPQPPTNPLPGLKFGPFFRVPYAETSKFNDPRDYDGDGVFDDLHEGQDFDIFNGAANSTEPVLCGYGGTVVRSEDSSGAYGKLIVVKSSWQNVDFMVWYCHLDARYVEVGDLVIEGQAIAELGATGGPWGEHVHINVQVPGLGLDGYVVPDVVDPDPYTTTEIQPSGLGLLGLHATADPSVAVGEIQAFKDARAEVIKVLSNIDPNNLAALIAEFPGVPVIVRIFLNFGGRTITPEQFYNDTINDVVRTVNKINQMGGGEIWLEIHNEPNLVQEGLGASWANGTEFVPWYIEVVNRYRADFTGTKILFPGLSPGGTIGGVRQAHTLFVEQARHGVEISDGLGVHTYWASNYPMQLALDVLDDYIQRFPGKPIWITEASNNKPATEQDKAAQYIAYANQLKLRPSVFGVTYFIASSQNPIWGWNNGSGEVWVGTNIPTIVGQR